ncbi:hypothetical protein DIPPA_53935 [Diplonema papillatum]|nr:hypothetical protein DIPPA_53935 [Diplonema papillatum]
MSDELPFSCIPPTANWFKSNVVDELGGRLVYGSRNNVICWEIATGRLIALIPRAHEGRPGVTCAVWANWSSKKQSGIVLSAGSDGSCKLWMVNGAQQTVSHLKTVHIESRQCVEACGVARTDGDVMHAVIGTSGGLVKRLSSPFHATQHTKQVTLFKHHAAISAVAVCSTQARLSKPSTLEADAVSAESFDSWVAIGCADGNIFVLHGDTSVFHWRGPHQELVQSLSFGFPVNTGQISDFFLASGCRAGRMTLWRVSPDLSDPKQSAYQSQSLRLETAQKSRAPGRDTIWSSVLFCPYTGYTDQLYTTAPLSGTHNIMHYNLTEFLAKWAQRGSPPGTAAMTAPEVLKGHNRPVLNLAFTRDLDPILVSLSIEKRMLFWDARRSKTVWTLPLLSTCPRSLAANSAGLLAVSEKDVLLWHVPNEHTTLPSQTDPGSKNDVPATNTSSIGYSLAKANPYSHRTHWRKVASPPVKVALSPCRENLAFATSDGEIGVAYDVHTASGKRTQHTDVPVSLASRPVLLEWVGPNLLIALGQSSIVHVVKLPETAEPPSHRSNSKHTNGNASVSKKNLVSEAGATFNVDAAGYRNGLLAIASGKRLSFFVARDFCFDSSSVLQEADATKPDDENEAGQKLLANKDIELNLTLVVAIPFSQVSCISVIMSGSGRRWLVACTTESSCVPTTLEVSCQQQPHTLDDHQANATWESRFLEAGPAGHSKGMLSLAWNSIPAAKCPLVAEGQTSLLLCTVGKDKKIALWAASQEQLRLVGVLPLVAQAVSVAWSPLKQGLLYFADDSCVHAVNIASFEAYCEDSSCGMDQVGAHTQKLTPAKRNSNAATEQRVKKARLAELKASPAMWIRGDTQQTPRAGLFSLPKGSLLEALTAPELAELAELVLQKLDQQPDDKSEELLSESNVDDGGRLLKETTQEARWGGASRIKPATSQPSANLALASCLFGGADAKPVLEMLAHEGSPNVISAASPVAHALLGNFDAASSAAVGCGVSRYFWAALTRSEGHDKWLSAMEKASCDMADPRSLLSLLALDRGEDVFAHCCANGDYKSAECIAREWHLLEDFKHAELKAKPGEVSCEGSLSESGCPLKPTTAIQSAVSGLYDEAEKVVDFVSKSIAGFSCADTEEGGSQLVEWLNGSTSNIAKLIIAATESVRRQHPSAQQLTDAYAVAWLLGMDTADTMQGPPAVSGGVHSAYYVRLFVAGCADTLRSSPYSSQILVSLQQWAARKPSFMSSCTMRAVLATIDALTGGIQQNPDLA